MSNYTHIYTDTRGFKYRLRFHKESHLPGFTFYTTETGQLLHIHTSSVQEIDDPTMNKPNPDTILDIENFHKKFGLHYDGPPRSLVLELEAFRMKFFEEEYYELVTATNNELKFDACIDLVYIILGYCHLRGWDFAEGWRRVHEANMKKIRAEKKSQSKRDSGFDVVKPEGWTPASLKDLVE